METSDNLWGLMGGAIASLLIALLLFAAIGAAFTPVDTGIREVIQ